MTVVELMVGLAIFGVAITVTLGFVASQEAAFQAPVESMGALRSVRHALTMVSKDLEALGTDVPRSRPALVYGDADVVVFSSNVTTNVVEDAAAFRGPDLAAGLVHARATGLTVPTAAHDAANLAHPSTSGVRSPTETLSYFFTPDTLTEREDDFLFVRQVNGGPPRVVARHVLRADGAPFFRYEPLVSRSGNPVLDTVSDSVLPLHRVPIGLSPGDGGRAAWPGGVSAVHVTIRGSNGLAGDDERTVDVSRPIPLPWAAKEAWKQPGT